MIRNPVLASPRRFVGWHLWVGVLMVLVAAGCSSDGSVRTESESTSTSTSPPSSPATSLPAPASTSSPTTASLAEPTSAPASTDVEQELAPPTARGAALQSGEVAVASRCDLSYADEAGAFSEIVITNVQDDTTRTEEIPCLLEGYTLDVGPDGRYLTSGNWFLDLETGRGAALLEHPETYVHPDGWTFTSVDEMAHALGGEGIEAIDIEITGWHLDVESQVVYFMMDDKLSQGPVYSATVPEILAGGLPALDSKYTTRSLSDMLESRTCYSGAGTTVEIKLNGECQSFRLIPGDRESAIAVSFPIGMPDGPLVFWATDGNQYKFDIETGDSTLLGPTPEFGRDLVPIVRWPQPFE